VEAQAVQAKLESRAAVAEKPIREDRIPPGEEIPVPLPRADEAASLTALRGSWIRGRPDGYHVTLDLDGHKMRLVARDEGDGRIAIEGNYNVTAEGILAGMTTRIQMNMPGFSWDCPVAKPFELRFARAGADVIVTDFQGSGWFEQGDSNFCGRYLPAAGPGSPRSEPRAAVAPSPRDREQDRPLPTFDPYCTPWKKDSIKIGL
jgi:hypothetical protein